MNQKISTIFKNRLHEILHDILHDILYDFDYAIFKQDSNGIIVDIRGSEFTVPYSLIYNGTQEEILEFREMVDYVSRSDSEPEPELDDILQFFYNKIQDLENRISDLEDEQFESEEFESEESSDLDIAQEIINVLINIELLPDTDYDVSLNYLESMIEIILEHDNDEITIVRVPVKLFYTGDEEDFIEYFS